jgi:hypothetical protein
MTTAGCPSEFAEEKMGAQTFHGHQRVANLAAEVDAEAKGEDFAPV